jgi:CheY-like chemotaxis protein
MGTDQDPTDEGEFVDRRSGANRRSGRERRQGGRRHRRLGVEEDRRKGADRRKATRRVVRDRRRKADPRYTRPRRQAPGDEYSPVDVATVQRQLSQVGGRVTCPVCRGSFALGRIERRGRDTARAVWCVDCGRSTVVTNCLLSRVMVITGIGPLRQMLQTILRGAGHEVVEPRNTRLALDGYRENPADLVLLDAFALEQMDGQEFIRRLRMEFRESRVIVLAPRPNYRAADPSAAAEGLGASGVLRMPFTRDELLRVVKEARV